MLSSFSAARLIPGKGLEIRSSSAGLVPILNKCCASDLCLILPFQLSVRPRLANVQGGLPQMQSFSRWPQPSAPMWQQQPSATGRGCGIVGPIKRGGVRFGRRDSPKTFSKARPHARVDPSSSMAANVDATCHQVFQCNACNATFTNKNNFIKHRKLHLGEYSYHCEVCGKGFNVKSNLEGHMAVQTQQKQYSCPICHAKASYKQSFKLHLKSKHGIKDEARLSQIISSVKFVSDIAKEEMDKM